MSDVGDDVVAVPEVRGEHAVVSGEVGAWGWDQRGKAGNEVEGVEDDVSGPVTEGVLESVDDLSPFIDREAFVGECRAGDVAAQAFEGVALVGLAARGGMEGKSRELSDAGGGRRRAGRDGVQGKRLASGVRADGDAVVDGGAEELLESVGGFEVEGGGLGVTEQQSLLLEGAGDAGGDGVEQALEFRLGRGGDTVEAGPFLFERVDAVDDEHVQVDVEVQRRTEALDEGDGSGAGTGAHAQSGATGEEGGDCPVDDGKDLGEDRGARREQEPQREGERHHPLADRLLGQDVVDEMRGGSR